MPEGQEPEDLILPVRQPSVRHGPVISDFEGQHLGLLWRHVFSLGVDMPDRVDEMVGRMLLVHEAGRTIPERSYRIESFGLQAEHEYVRLLVP